MDTMPQSSSGRAESTDSNRSGSHTRRSRRLPRSQAVATLSLVNAQMGRQASTMTRNAAPTGTARSRYVMKTTAEVAPDQMVRSFVRG